MPSPPLTATASTSHHVESMDALRGYAILAVILVHAAKVVDGLPAALLGVCHAGQYGVQLFFIASAMTLAMSIDRRSPGELHPTRAFFVRRLLRIAPMFWFGIFLYQYALVPYLPIAREYAGSSSAVDVLLTGAFLHGWTPQTITGAMPGSWSIAVEWTFYALLPFVFPLLGTARRAWWGCVIACGFAIVAQALAWGVIWVADPASFSVQPHPDKAFLRWWFPAQAVVFMLGVYVYRIHGDLRTHARSASLLALAILAVVVAGNVLVQLSHKSTVFSLFLAAFTCYLVAHPGSWLVSRLVGAMGKVSFSAYVLHFAILDIVAMLLPLPGLSPTLRLFAVFGSAVMTTYAASWVTYRVIEQPGIALGRQLARRVGGRPRPTPVSA